MRLKRVRRFLHWQFLFCCFSKSVCEQSEEQRSDLLKQLFKDFDVFGGAEFRIAAADSDVKVGSNGAIIAGMVPPNLESVRGRINAGGKLPIDPQAPAELSISLTDDPSEMRIRWATQAQGLTGARVEAIGCVPCTTDAKLAEKRSSFGAVALPRSLVCQA